MRFRPFFAFFPILSMAGTALAESPPGASSKQIVTDAAQARLHAAIVGNELVYRACDAEPCELSTGAERIQIGDGAEVTLRKLAIGAGRQIVWAHGPAFDAFVAAVPGTPAEARLLWSGPTGPAEGLPGERRGALVEVGEPDEGGQVYVLVGESREDVSLCGRPTLLAPKFLDPVDLQWKPAKAPRFSKAERDAAPRLQATKQAEPPSPALASVLRARVATSAVGDPGALTDGNLETTWAEGRKGDGKGEFVVLDVARDVPLTGLSFVIRPEKRAIPQGAAPKQLWLSTSDRLFSISLPDRAWSERGASYRVSFDAPLETSCMAIVLEEASAPKGRDVEVTLAEVVGHTAFDDALAPALLVNLLDSGGAQAKAARAMLQRSGEDAFVATADRFLDLGEAGRALALEVLDVAPCSISASVYLDAAVSKPEGQAHHAKDRLRRCGKEATNALVSGLAQGPDEKRILAAQALSTSAPETAVPAIVDLLPALSGKTKVELRAALARAASSPQAADVFLERLRDEAAHPEATLSLLRALPARADLVAEASAAHARLSAADSSFRMRYLLLEPAARLASLGSAEARAWLKEALADPSDRHLRMRAAEVAALVPDLADEVLAAVGDGEPRVREAAVSALGTTPDPRAVDPLLGLLRQDPWTFVRARSADALASYPAMEAVDSALGESLSDAAVPVRVRALEAIAKRGAVSQLAKVRARLGDDREVAEVRGRAARALGELCDTASADTLLALVRRGASPVAKADAQQLAMASLAALGRLHPADLQAKLAPYMGEGAPRVLAIAAQAAVEREDVCRAR